MKRIIKGKLYNTEAATEIACYSNNAHGFEHESETLYVTLKGDFFIEYAGGPKSKYAVYSTSNSISGSDGITAMNGITDVLEWCEDREIEINDEIQHLIKSFSTSGVHNLL